jgi:hypothetical protein
MILHVKLPLKEASIQSNLGVAINGKRFVITYKSILSVASKVEDF